MDIFDYAQCGIHADPLREMCDKRGITDPQDQCRLLGQLTVESGGFKRVVENLNYRSDTLLALFKGRNGGLNTIDDCAAVVMGGPQAIAEAIYGGSWGAQHLGNTSPGDGFKFIGHGLGQITGRSNHQAASTGLYGDDRLISTPELLTVARVSAEAACWFWMSRELNGVADVQEVTRRFNGGLNGLADRIKATESYLLWLPS